MEYRHLSQRNQVDCMNLRIQKQTCLGKERGHLFQKGHDPTKYCAVSAQMSITQMNVWL